MSENVGLLADVEMAGMIVLKRPGNQLRVERKRKPAAFNTDPETT